MRGNTEVFANSSGLFCSECGIRVARYTKINEKSYEDVLIQCIDICESTPSCSVCKIKITVTTIYVQLMYNNLL